jgi:hypothetical protein
MGHRYAAAGAPPLLKLLAEPLPLDGTPAPALTVLLDPPGDRVAPEAARAVA